MKILALDFDGVLSDSAPEAMVVALRAWEQHRPGSSLVKETARAAGFDRAGILGSSFYARFVDLMPLGNNATDYAILLDILEHDAESSIKGQADYDRYRAGVDPQLLAEFPRSFYETRWAMAAERTDDWLGLMIPYPGLLELLRRRAGDVLLTIATAKDGRTVRQLLERYGASDLFPAERLIDKEAGPSKRAHLGILLDRFGVAPEELLFVDDKLNHLEDVSALGVGTGLAGWGYNGERERVAAGSGGHLVLDLEGLEGQLFGG